MSLEIPGFVIEDEKGNVIAENPGQPSAGRRAYNDGEQVDRPKSSSASAHSYLLRVPKGLWKAFSRKCKNEGVPAREVIELLIKDWVMGKVDLDELKTRR